MNQNPFHFSQFIDFINKKLRNWAIGILIGIVIIVIFLDCFLISHLEAHKLDSYANLSKSFEGVLLNIIPALIGFILIEPIIKKIDNFDDPSNELKNEFTNLQQSLSFLKLHPEIYGFLDSYQNLNWDELVKDADSIDLCLFYCGSEWKARNSSAFLGFFKNGGELNLYLPSITELEHKFLENNKPKDSIIVRILNTANEFRSLESKAGTGKLKTHLVKSGLNFMFARIHPSKENRSLFLFSPYQNTYEEVYSPVVIIDESKTSHSPALKNFIAHELEFVKKSDALPECEQDKLIIWDKDARSNRVFVSLSLSCPGRCSFCYIESLVQDQKAKSKDGASEFGKLIALTLSNDDRFKKGKNGTTILLGGFTDPLHKSNIAESLGFIDEISVHGNLIHLATRYGFGKSHIDNITTEKYNNLIINYSLSSFEDGVEVKNQSERFKEAKQLIARGLKVSLYLRPILPGKTIREIDKIIKECKESGIAKVVVGGLYIDDRIKESLKKKGIVLKNQDSEDKGFVLDDRKLLKKLRIPDVEKITALLEKDNIRVFENSTALVSFFRNNSLTHSLPPAGS